MNKRHVWRLESTNNKWLYRIQCQMFIENVSVHKRDEDHEDNEDLFKVNQMIEYIDLLNDLTMAAVARRTPVMESYVLVKTLNCVPNLQMGVYYYGPRKGTGSKTDTTNIIANLCIACYGT